MTTEQSTPPETADSAEAETLKRGQVLVGAVGIGLAVLSTVLVFGLAWEGVYGAHYMIPMVKLAWVFFVFYQLTRGRAWARWLTVISLALSIMLAIAGLVAPPPDSSPMVRPLSGALLPLLALGLYVLLFSDSAAVFFKKTRTPS